jgi:hypothetical protein
MEVLFFVLMYFILSFPPRVAAAREESQIEQPRVRDVSASEHSGIQDFLARQPRAGMTNGQAPHVTARARSSRRCVERRLR